MTGAGRTTAALAVGAGVLLLSVRVLRSRIALIRVTGSSMAPAFADGDRLLVRRTTRVRHGDAVVFRNPFPFGDGDDPLAWLVKRVAALPGDPVPPDVRDIVGAPDGGLVPSGSLVVRGDAARTQDSRHFGYVPESSLLGVVLTRPNAPGRSRVRPFPNPAD
ncbi:S26 family signal peptidase [Streptomyces sp. NPDC001795]|uniref:S26 family signal peptidase n=1 Tax=unclassified Streptomyces TaxID=2593676 RepID=UPI0033257445